MGAHLLFFFFVTDGTPVVGTFNPAWASTNTYIRRRR